MTAQDKRLVELLDERKTPFMVVLTKIDLVPAGRRAALKRRFAEELSFCSHVPMLTASARTGEGLQALLNMADRIRSECSVRVGTGPAQPGYGGGSGSTSGPGCAPGAAQVFLSDPG